MAQGRYLGQPVAVKVQGLCLDDQDDLDELSVEVCGGRHLGEGLSSQGIARRSASSLDGCAPAR